MAYIGKQPTVGNFQVCDAISVVNGQAAYTLQVGGVNVAPESANHMLVSLNGILQKPGSSFTISGSTMTFASNLTTGDVIDFVQILGNVLDIGQPSDDTVTAAKLNNDIISGQTALTSSPDDTDELLISDAGTIKRIDVSLVGGKNTPAFQAHMNGNQTIGTSSWTKLEMDTEVFDTDGTYDHSTNYRFTPAVAGKYWVWGKFRYDDGSDITDAQMGFYKNGSLISKTTEFSTDPTTIKLGQTITLDSDDYLEIYAYQNSGTNSTINGNSSFPEQDAGTWGAYKLIGV